jgi:hypothetical protein
LLLFLLFNKSTYDIIHCFIDRVKALLAFFDPELAGAVLEQVAMLMVGIVGYAEDDIVLAF